MFKTTDYLRKSPDGWYSYRRRVPSKLVELFPFKEFQKAYNTKNKARAFTQHAAYHKEVERQIKEAETLLKSIPTAQEPKTRTPSKLFQKVYTELKSKGYLPHQMASSNVTMTEADRLAWMADDKAFSEATVLYDADQLTAEEYTDVINNLQHEPFKKFAQHRDYIRYLEELEDEEEFPEELKIKLKILKGDYTPPDATIEDVFNLYIDVQRKKVINKERSPQQERKVEQDTERLAELVYSAHIDGKTTLIDDLDETVIDHKFTAQYPRTDTRKRNYSAMSAAIQLWNKRQPKKKINDPFLNLKMELPKEDPDKIPRRVWHPDEFQYFWQSIQTEPNLSIKIMGMLMAYGGKPQGETARLTRENVVLEWEVPHINFEYAIKGKNRQKHRLPLVGVMLEVVEEYISTFSGGQHDLLFPALHRMDTGSRSKAINKHIKEMHPIRNTVFEPYGLRHTFKPRYEEAGITTVNGMYLFGHKSDQTTATHEGYAKGLFGSKEFKQLRDDMEKVMAVTSWTYSYIVSDFD